MIRSYRDQAIVLRTHKLGEADRIVCLLTKENGQVRTVAKGVRRTTSKFGARLEPFSLIDVQLHRGRTFDIVTQVEMLRPYGTQLASDFDLFAAGTVMVETAERLTGDSADGAHAQYSLLLGALHALANLRHDPVLVVDSYLLRALSVAGWAPSCFACASCGKPGPHTSFSISEGGALCDECQSEGGVAVSENTMELMGHLLAGNWDQADRTEAYDRQRVAHLTSAYTQWHLERKLRALQLFERKRA